MLDARNAFYQLIQDYSVARKEKDDSDCETETINEVEISAGPTTTESKIEKIDDKLDENAGLTEEETMKVGGIQWNVFKIYANSA